MTNKFNDQSSNDATAWANPKLSLVERLDQLQWQLDDIDMNDVDRFEIDHYLGALLQHVAARADRKKRKWVARLLKKTFSWKRSRKIFRKLVARKIRGTDPILPLVVFVPSGDEPDVHLTDTATISSSLDNGDIIYYLQDDAYLSKAPSFFKTFQDDKKKKRGHKRTLTAETLRMDSSMDPDTFEKIDDDCFFGLSTGIESD